MGEFSSPDQEWDDGSKTGNGIMVESNSSFLGVQGWECDGGSKTGNAKNCVESLKPNVPETSQILTFLIKK